MNPSEQSNSNSANQDTQDTQDTQDDQTSASDSFEVKPEPKPTMSKREIMEELSRQRFPWEE